MIKGGLPPPSQGEGALSYRLHRDKNSSLSSSPILTHNDAPSLREGGVGSPLQPRELCSGKHGQQTQEHTGCRVEGCEQSLVGTEEAEPLVTKGGESGESAAETHGEQQLQVGISHDTAVGPAVNEADEQASGHVNCHGSQRQLGKYAARNEPGEHEPKYRPGGSTHCYQYHVVYHTGGKGNQKNENYFAFIRLFMIK